VLGRTVVARTVDAWVGSAVMSDERLGSFVGNKVGVNGVCSARK